MLDRRTMLPLTACAMLALVLAAGRADALEVIVFEELKETAVEYGKINGRFITCDIRPPVPIRASVLKYARRRGASDQHLEILSKIYDDGQARTTGLKKGFSKEECKEKLAEPRTQQFLEQITEWYDLPPHLKP